MYDDPSIAYLIEEVNHLFLNSKWSILDSTNSKKPITFTLDILDYL